MSLYFVFIVISFPSGAGRGSHRLCSGSEVQQRQQDGEVAVKDIWKQRDENSHARP